MNLIIYIVTHKRDEVLQKFIEDNPILSRRFPAHRILLKPPILTFYNADFAILSPQGELTLLTYDDLAAGLAALIEQIRRL